MPTSADRRRAGFTLLEVMVTLAVVALAVVPMLYERDKAWNMALRTSNMMRAATYADEVLAEHLLDPDDRKEYPGLVEADPDFRYEITIETYDLSTGRVESEEDEDGFSDTSNFSSTSAFAPPDALEAAPGVDPDADSPHRVRRYKVHMWFPGYEVDEREQEYVLEGYAPVALDLPEPTNGSNP